jgi:hypothetical protein
VGYRHINNLYKSQEILMFKECYVSEKIHGTSAHLSWDVDNTKIVRFFSGGSCHQTFCNLFDVDALTQMAHSIDVPKWTIYGEAYGGKLQGMKETYGLGLKFVAFEAKVNDMWLDTHKAKKFASRFDLDFVWYTQTRTDLDLLNKYRDQPSKQAEKCGMGSDKKSEGIVIRPLLEMTKNDGGRIMAKHKALEFCETKTPRVVTEEELRVLVQVKEIAEEWVTENRLTNILSRTEKDLEIQDIPKMIDLMIEDVLREGEGELVKSRALVKAISRKTALMVKVRVQL